jgi:putative hydrolase of the HAD superfamily
MINPSGIKNIIFDFGGVLFEIDYNLPIKAFAELGYPNFHEVYTQANQNEIFDQLETGKISNEQFLRYLHTLAPDATMLDVSRAWNCILLRLWPERVEFVKKLRNKGYKTFLLSNTNAIHVAEFEEMIDDTMGIENFQSAFEHIYYSNKIGIKKPYPETYLELCSWNNLEPAETLFIDDSKQHVEGALRAGLHAYHIQPSQSIVDLMSGF